MSIRLCDSYIDWCDLTVCHFSGGCVMFRGNVTSGDVYMWVNISMILEDSRMNWNKPPCCCRIWWLPCREKSDNNNTSNNKERERGYWVQTWYRDIVISVAVSYSQATKQEQQTGLFQFILEPSRIIDTFTHVYTSPEAPYPLKMAYDR